jgi:hypothetical protein
VNDDYFEVGEVIQVGRWWWKRYVVAIFIPDCGAPSGSWNGGGWNEISERFKTREEAEGHIRALRSSDQKGK